ncbi:WD repeat-containing protein [Plectosphaerella plurivora]|uniref:WD repeat-containing protein n=1 Tax=Plectosphaerella plurivora TaxID=936078 RepID=A0A9P8V3L6_9PEZI|nr:WD repeat-containing protein [Plectosphaerella plurivora]
MSTTAGSSATMSEGGRHDSPMELEPGPSSRLSSPVLETPRPLARHAADDPSISDSQSVSIPRSTAAAIPKRTPTKPAPTKPIRTTPFHDGARTSKDLKTPVRASPAPAPSLATPTASGIDPLSQHILMRTNTENASSPRLRLPQNRPDSPGPDVLQRLGSDTATKHSSVAPVDVKDKRKGSFLSRLSMRGRKRDDDLGDDMSEMGEPRLSGSDARVFSSSVGAAGYIPHHKEPPRYIKVRAHNKKNREFNRTFLAQQLSTSPPEDASSRPSTSNGGDKSSRPAGGPIWAMEFSKDGKYLAAAGKDQVIRVWSVISTQEERKHHEEDETADKGTDERLSAPVFRSKVTREFAGHTGEVLDLSWSKNSFLLSSSMDKTVRLWHMSRQECLCIFKHKDFVTSIAFHPTDDRFFLAGSLDAQLRLWSIPDKSIAFSAQLPDLVTAVAFSPDGKTAIGGVLNGMCLFYDTEGLKLQSQMHVRSSRGKNAKGSKITGIKTITMPTRNGEGQVKVLITSNDSRIRLYNLKDKALEMKLKGHENLCSQLRASVSDDARYILCGSEDKRAFLWSLKKGPLEDTEKTPYEYFDAHSTRVTATAIAPIKTRQLLSSSGDPLYDLCNPPPVKLMSLEESMAASQTNLSEYAERPAPSAPSSASPKETPAYLEKSKHLDGNIIVTADQSGVIKVFRQDCAFVKRRYEVWETGSNFSKKLVNQGSILGRSGSIITRTSVSSHPRSRRTSLSQSVTGPNTSDHINNWRHGIDSGRNSHRSSMIGGASIRSERSTSPSRWAGQSGSNGVHSPPMSTVDGRRSTLQRKRSQSQTAADISTQTIRASRAKNWDLDETATQPPTPSFSFRPVEEDEEPETRQDDAGSNTSFWNRWRGISSMRAPSAPPSSGMLSPRILTNPPGVRAASRPARLKASEIFRDPPPSDKEGTEADNDSESQDVTPYSTRPQPSRMQSLISRLSSEFSSDDGGDVRTCDKCGCREFKTKQMAGRVRLLCSRCAKVVDDV